MSLLRKFGIIALLCAIWSVLAPSAQALLYSARENPNLELISLDDPEVDQAVRLKVIREARHSVESISFAQALDEVGAPQVDAMRGVLARGLPLHAMFDMTGSRIEGDGSRRTEKLLADSSLSCQGQVICLRPMAKLMNGLSIDDAIHEKILIIDRGTPDVKIIVGGRNNTKLVHDLGDSAFVLRPVDPSKPWAGDDLENLYDDIWDHLVELFGTSNPTEVRPKTLSALRKNKEFKFSSDAKQAQFQVIANLLNRRPGPESGLLPFQFRPQSFQLASNDMLETLISTRAKRRHSKRNGLPNDILELLHSTMKGKRDLLYTGYAVGFPDSLRSDLMEHVENGGKLTLLSNGREAFEKMTRPFSPSRLVGAAAADYTMENILPFLEKSDRSSGRVEAYLLNPNISEEAYNYLHRKLFIMDDVVGTGSDPLTMGTSKKNDEYFMIMKDKRMADYLRAQIARERSSFFRSVSTDEARAEHAKRSWASRCLRPIIERSF